MTHRKYHLDILRTLSIFAVIVLHAAGRCVRYGTPDQLDWQICQSFVSMFSWAVPVFVMISGALFLAPQKEISLKALYTKYIPHLAIAYLFWSFLYTLFLNTMVHYDSLSIPSIWNTIFCTLQGGSAHLWFLWMILGLYILIPILRSCLQNISEVTLKYWLMIGFLFCSILPLLRNLGIFESIFGANIDILTRSMFGEYVFYFVLGYALEHKSGLFKHTAILYALGGISLIVTIGTVAVQSLYFPDSAYFLLSNSSPAMVMISMALYVLLRARVQKKAKPFSEKHLCVRLSPYVFGIYLVHNLFLDTLGIALIEKTQGPLPLTLIMFILTVATSIFSFAIVWLIRRIKPVAKYIT